MYSLEDIESRSSSNNEMVVEYIDAMELLYIYEKNQIKVLGWEGWIKYPNGSLGHSKRYQGTTDLSTMPIFSAISLMKSTIIQAHSESEEKPEVENAILLFGITTNT